MAKQSDVIAMLDSRARFTPSTNLTVLNNSIQVNAGSCYSLNPALINTNITVDSQDDSRILNMFDELKIFLNRTRFRSADYYKELKMIMANLQTSANYGRELLYSRRSGSSSKIRINIIDFLAHQNHIIHIKGSCHEYGGNSSWMFPAEKLLHQFRSTPLTITFSLAAPQVILRDHEGAEKEISYAQSQLVAELSLPVRLYNQCLSLHQVTLEGRQISPYCRRIFNHSLSLGGRFYGGMHQGLPKDIRACIQIDNTPVKEPDYKGIHIHLLYNQKGLHFDSDSQDPYAITGYDRAVTKSLTLRLVNCKSLPAFSACITKSGNPKIKESMKEYESKKLECMLSAANGKSCRMPKRPPHLEGFIPGMPDHIEGKDFLSEIQKAHRPIADLFQTENIGLKLQFLDSKIMAHNLIALSDRDIPVLPVHDSLCCRESDVDEVSTVMHAGYKAITGFKCCVDTQSN